VDRMGHAAVSWIAGVVGGLAVLGIPLLHAWGALSGPALLPLVVLGAAFDAPGMAAHDSPLPELGREAGLTVERLASIKAVMGHVAVLGGPVAGGAAIGLVGAAPAVGLSGACSVIAGLLASGVLRRRRAFPSSTDRSMRAGLRFLWREPLLRPALGIVTVFAGIASAMGAVIVPALFIQGGRPPAELGLFSSAQGAGGLAGIALHAAVGARLPAQLWLSLAFAGFAGVALVLSLLPALPMLIFLGTITGLMTGPVSPILNAALYSRTPPSLRGRVIGAWSAVLLSAAPFVTVAAGMVVDHAGPGSTLIATGALLLGVAAVTLRLRFDAVPAAPCLAPGTHPSSDGEP